MSLMSWLTHNFDRRSQLIHDENDEKHEHGASLKRMYRGCQDKIVLCCSALTKAERVIINDGFEALDI